MKPSLKKRRIAKAHLEGKSNDEIAQVEYPDAKQGAALVSRALHDDDTELWLEQTKLQALKKYKVDYEMIIKPRVEAVKATYKDGTVNHTVRLNATDKLERMLENKHISEKVRDEILKIPEGTNLIEAQKLIFKQSD